MKKIAVLNFSGNVGKSTVSAQLLQPRMPGAKILSVESINEDSWDSGGVGERVRGAQFKHIQDELMRHESVIVDIGSSNIEDFFKLMLQFTGSHDEIDLFLIPVVKERKVQSDTMNTMDALVKAGISKDKIRLVFNKLDSLSELHDDFASVIGYAEAKGFKVIEDAAISANEVFDLIKGGGKSLTEINEDRFDYRAAVRTASSPEEKEQHIRMVGIKRLAASATKNLDAVFSAVTA